MNATQKAISEVVDQHARAVAALWPGTDVEDLRSEGWIFALNAIEKYDESINADKPDAVQRFLSRNLNRALRRAAAQMSAPVHYRVGYEVKLIRELGHQYTKSNYVGLARATRTVEDDKYETYKACDMDTVPARSDVVDGNRTASVEGCVRDIVYKTGGHVATRALIYGHPHKKIAADAGCSMNTVHSSIRRARKGVASKATRDMLEVFAQ